MSYPNYPSYEGYYPVVQQQQAYPHPSEQGGYPSYQPSQGAGYPPQQPTYPPYPNESQQPSYSPVVPQLYPTAPGYTTHPLTITPNPRALNPYPAVPSSVHHQNEQCTPSVHPHQPFDARVDADALHKAMKGFGTREKQLIAVVCKRTCTQRALICQAYKSGYGKDLEAKIKSETSGAFAKVLVALTLSRAELMARELHGAVDGIGTKEGTLIEILISGSNQDVREMNEAYVKMYGRPLEKDIKGDTSGTFKMLLVSLAQGHRDEASAVDHQKVKDDARRLHQAGAGKLGTDESAFNSILATRSWAHLKQLMVEYQSMNGRSLEQAVASEFSANAERGLVGILERAKSRPAYFAKRLNGAMRGAGTRDGTLIRIIVSRCDIDLGSIKVEYQRLFGRSLQAAVSGDTSGDYKNALLTLIG